MKRLIILALFFTSCGYSARDNTMTGQVKKVIHNTPILCPDYYDVDVSLGVIRNGIGSMSTEDTWLVVPERQDIELLKKAAETGALVDITYDVKRVTFCTDDHFVVSVKLAK